MFRSRTIVSTLVGLAVSVGLLAACTSSPAPGDSLTISGAWARPGEAGSTSAVYFVVDNPGAEADNLIAAQTNAAQSAELHKSAMDSQGVMSMEHQEQIPVPAGGKVELTPGGLHVMLTGLTTTLQPGDHLSLTLTFEKAGEISLEVPVRQEE